MVRSCALVTIDDGVCAFLFDRKSSNVKGVVQNSYRFYVTGFYKTFVEMTRTNGRNFRVKTSFKIQEKNTLRNTKVKVLTENETARTNQNVKLNI